MTLCPECGAEIFGILDRAIPLSCGRCGSDFPWKWNILWHNWLKTPSAQSLKFSVPISVIIVLVGIAIAWSFDPQHISAISGIIALFAAIINLVVALTKAKTKG